MFRAHIRHEPWRRHVDIFVVDDRPDGSVIVYGPGDQARIIPAGATLPDDVEPSLRVPEDALPALLAALSSHLGAVEHPQQLRRDYDAERARVDQALTALTALVLR